MSIRDIIRTCLFTPNENGWGLPMAFWEGPGVGKTFIIREVAAQCGLLCEVLSPGERGEGAFGCVPMPKALAEKVAVELGVDTALTYPMPEWAIKFFRAGRGVLFVDELTTAPPALQPPMLGLFLDKRIGGTQLPRALRTVAAYNPADSAANGHDLPKPTANRMGHMKWDGGTPDDHSDYVINTIGSMCTLDDKTEEAHVAKTAELDPEAEEKRVLHEWPAASAAAAGLYAAFIRKRPDLLHKEPPAHDPQASGSWPSRRTWSYAVRAYAGAKVHKLSDEDTDSLICAFVGDGAGGEWLDFIREQDLPDAQDLLDGKLQWEHDPARLDVTHVVLDACCAYTCPKEAPKRDSRAKALWKLIDAIVDAGAKDIAYPAARRMAKAGHLKHAESRPVLKKLNKVMKAAGIQIQG